MMNDDDEIFRFRILKLIANRAGDLDSIQDLIDVCVKVESCIDESLLMLKKKKKIDTTIAKTKTTCSARIAKHSPPRSKSRTSVARSDC